MCLCYQVRDGAMSDLQTQLREVLRENELLRREVRTLADTHTHLSEHLSIYFTYQNKLKANELEKK